MTAFSRAWDEPGRGQSAFSLAQYNGKLYFFGQYGQLHLNSIDLTHLIHLPDGTLTTDETTFKNALTTTDFGVNTDYNVLHSESPSSSAATVAGSHLCLFWNDDRKGPTAAVCDATNIDGPVRPWYTLLTATGQKLSDIAASTHDVAATTLDDDNLLVAMHTGSGDSRSIWVGQYQVSGKRTDAKTGSHDPGTWQAVAAWTIPISTLLTGDLHKLLADNLDGSLHIAWYSHGQPTKPYDAPTAWLGLTLYSPSQSMGMLCWVSVDFASPPTLLIGGSYGPNVAEVGPVYGPGRSAVPYTLQRTPSGTIHIYSATVETDPSRTLSATLTFIYAMPGDQKPSEPQFQTLISPCTRPGSDDRLDIDRPVVSAFLVAPTAVQTIVSGDTIHSTSIGAFPVGEALFAHTDGVGSPGTELEFAL